MSANVHKTTGRKKILPIGKTGSYNRSGYCRLLGCLPPKISFFCSKKALPTFSLHSLGVRISSSPPTPSYTPSHDVFSTQSIFLVCGLILFPLKALLLFFRRILSYDKNELHNEPTLSSI